MSLVNLSIVEGKIKELKNSAGAVVVLKPERVERFVKEIGQTFCKSMQQLSGDFVEDSTIDHILREQPGLVKQFTLIGRICQTFSVSG